MQAEAKAAESSAEMATDAMVRSVAAAIGAIEHVKAERAAERVRVARFTLAAAYGVKRLRRQAGDRRSGAAAELVGP